MTSLIHYPNNPIFHHSNILTSHDSIKTSPCYTNIKQNIIQKQKQQLLT
jgi:hypothetical protein